MVKYIEWAKMGIVIGLFWGIIITLLGTAIGGILGGLSGGLLGGAIGGIFGFGILIGVTIAGAIKYPLGRFITEHIKWFSNKPYWRIFQVSIIGGVIWEIISSLLGSTGLTWGIIDIVIIIIGSLINSWVILFMYKQLKWKLPN